MTREKLTFVDSSILEDELVDKLESLRFGNQLHLTQQRVVCKVVLRRSWDSLYCFAILNATITVVPVITSKLFLYQRKNERQKYLQKQRIRALNRLEQPDYDRSVDGCSLFDN